VNDAASNVERKAQNPEQQQEDDERPEHFGYLLTVSQGQSPYHFGDWTLTNLNIGEFREINPSMLRLVDVDPSLPHCRQSDADWGTHVGGRRRLASG
jgi:hypothetical protein